MDWEENIRRIKTHDRDVQCILRSYAIAQLYKYVPAYWLSTRQVGGIINISRDCTYAITLCLA